MNKYLIFYFSNIINQNMVKTISIKTKIGWVSAYENKGKIVRIKFGKEKKQNKDVISEK